MDVDQRLGALVSRHEALSQNVEVMSGMLRDILRAISQDAEHIRALVRESRKPHSHRLDEQDGRIDRLEGGAR